MLARFVQRTCGLGKTDEVEGSSDLYAGKISRFGNSSDFKISTIEVLLIHEGQKNR